MNLLTKGNKKLSKTIFGFALPPVKSCLNHKLCSGTCYAKFPYRFYPDCGPAWDRNFDLARSGEFKEHVVGQLKRAKICKFVRIHVSGDFFSQDYIDAWAEIAKMFPGLKFYTYSKVWDILDLTKLAALDNVNVINSIAPDGGLNYGDEERLQVLKSFGYRVCPGVKNKKIHCGKNCFICTKIEKVCFPKHK